MIDEYNKCRFCKRYDDFDGCEFGCINHKGFEPNKFKIIEKSKETGLSVADIIALINLEE